MVFGGQTKIRYERVDNEPNKEGIGVACSEIGADLSLGGVNKATL